MRGTLALQGGEEVSFYRGRGEYWLL